MINSIPRRHYAISSYQWTHTRPNQWFQEPLNMISCMIRTQFWTKASCPHSNKKPSKGQVPVPTTSRIFSLLIAFSKQSQILNSKNSFNTFLPTDHEQPRLTVLQNFKEISRIMTNNYLKHKELEVKYHKQQIP